MKNRSGLSRRKFMQHTGAGMLAAMMPFGNKAWARESITAVEWGGPWLEASNSLLSAQNEFQVNWVLHAGSSSAIVPKIKSGLPRIRYDVVHSFPPVTAAMLAEDWLEPLSLDTVPNLADVNESFLTRNANNEIINCPTSSIGAFWGCRSEDIEHPIAAPEDLLHPSLKGKVLALSPTLQSGRFLLSLALARGGNERNIDPGFEFAKELARRGNIGRVAKSDVEIINSITSGETAITFSSLSSWWRISQSQKIDYLVKMAAGGPMFKTIISQEEWVLLKGAPQSEAAARFLNWYISPPVHEQYCALLGVLPINRKSRPPKNLEFFVQDNDEDRERFEYYPDYPFISSQLKAWNERWESEVTPLLS